MQEELNAEEIADQAVKADQNVEHGQLEQTEARTEANAGRYNVRDNQAQRGQVQIEMRLRRSKM